MSDSGEAKTKDGRLTPARWARIRDVFERASEALDRDAFLAEACRGDYDLRREVESLLAHDSSATNASLDVGVWQTVSSAFVPREIGKYRIIALVGEGGMGTVYQAEQENPRRMVALKVIRGGWSNLDLLRRFELEAEALGRLQHPGIAQIYEAGATEAGFGPQPYFAMEFIRGETLRHWAEKQSADTRQVLEIMARVCDAVHHAHQRGLIHRDLKPGNILVDSTGQPKILDFGVARFTDSDAQATRHTVVGQLVGTLAYMSPEQVLADPLEVDTRSDVYSLGVILYELLAGCPPFVLSQKMPEALETIREQDPPSLGSMNGACRGDVETIVAKALEKDKNRRYGSAAALAADLRRYLEDEPITARAPTAIYQAQKFARRHRALVLGVAAVFVVLAMGVVASTWEAVRANQARRAAIVERDRATGERNRAEKEKRRADEEFATTKAINDFLLGDLLAQASVSYQAKFGSGAKPDPDVKVRTLLDRAAAKITGRFTGQPAQEASVRQTIAQTYEEMGLYAPAQEQAQRALRLWRSLGGDDDSRVLASMDTLADLHRLMGQYPEAEALALKARDARQREFGAEDPQTLRAESTLASIYQEEGKSAQSEKIFRTVLDIQRRTLGADHPDALVTRQNLAHNLLLQGRYPEAESTLAQLVESDRRVYGQEHPVTLSAMYDLGLALSDQGKFDQAEAVLVKTLDSSTRLLGEENPNTMLTLSALAVVYRNRGDYLRVESIDSRIIEIQRRTLGESHPDTLSTMNNLAVAYLYEGKYPAAENIAKPLVDIDRLVLGTTHPDTLTHMNLLAVIYRGQRKYDLAEPLLQEVVDGRRRVLGAEHVDTLKSMHALAAVYRKEGKYSQAEALLMATQQLRHRVLGGNHPDTRSGMILLGAIELEEHKFPDAERVLRQAIESYQKNAPGHWEGYYGETLLGSCLIESRKYAEAEPLLLSGYEGLRDRLAEIPSESRPVLDQAGERIVHLYRLWDKPDEEAEWQRKLRGN